MCDECVMCNKAQSEAAHAAYLIAAKTPTPQTPFAGSIHRGGLHALKPRYRPYVDDQPILQAQRITLL